MLLTDVHAHLDFEDFQDIEHLIPEWKEKGVRAVISNGIDPESNRKTLNLAKKFDIVKPALGYYPVHAIAVPEEEFDKELDFIERSRPMALGEVGLDYSVSDDNPFGSEKRAEMKACFHKLISLAEKRKIPMIVHSRKAELDTIEMLESSSTKKIVMHCFMGKKHLVKRIVDNGWYTSIPCIVTRLEQLQDMVRLQDISRIFTETDSPYMSPYKDIKRNEPPFVVEAVNKIAELKGMDAEEVANNIFKNYQDMFL